MHQTDSPCLRQLGTHSYSLVCWDTLLPRCAIVSGCRMQLEAACCLMWPEHCWSDVCVLSCQVVSAVYMHAGALHVCAINVHIWLRS